MKTLKTVLFSSSCVLVFLLAVATSCALRAKYSLVPKVTAEFAYMYASNLDRYSFLQYNQAGPDQGKEALIAYLKLLQRIEDEHIQYPLPILHSDFGLTYLRLYRLESAAGNSTGADDYMKLAQTEWSALGWKSEQVSPEALRKLIETRESNEQKLYNDIGIQVAVAQGKQDGSRENSE